MERMSPVPCRGAIANETVLFPIWLSPCPFSGIVPLDEFYSCEQLVRMAGKAALWLGIWRQAAFMIQSISSGGYLGGEWAYQ